MHTKWSEQWRVNLNAAKTVYVFYNQSVHLSPPECAVTDIFLFSD